MEIAIGKRWAHPHKSGDRALFGQQNARSIQDFLERFIRQRKSFNLSSKKRDQFNYDAKAARIVIGRRGSAIFWMLDAAIVIMMIICPPARGINY